MGGAGVFENDYGTAGCEAEPAFGGRVLGEVAAKGIEAHRNPDHMLAARRNTSDRGRRGRKSATIGREGFMMYFDFSEAAACSRARGCVEHREGRLRTRCEVHEGLNVVAWQYVPTAGINGVAKLGRTGCGNKRTGLAVCRYAETEPAMPMHVSLGDHALTTGETANIGHP